MYMIEISENKVDCLVNHMVKGLKYLGKAMECIEEMQQEQSYEIPEDEEYFNEIGYNRFGNRGGRGRMRFAAGGNSGGGSGSGGSSGRYGNY